MAVSTAQDFTVKYTYFEIAVTAAFSLLVFNFMLLSSATPAILFETPSMRFRVLS